MNLQTLTLSTLKPAPYNPRKISDDAMGRLEKSVKEWGIVDPLIVNKATGYTIIGGHQRFKVLQKQGVETADRRLRCPRSPPGERESSEHRPQ